MSCSLIILTRDSSSTLEACLKSALSIASEIVVVDSGSSDASLEIARKYKAKIFERKLQGFGEQKQFALDQTTGEWALVLDSDEELTAPLVEEIKKILENPSGKFCAYRIPRKNFYLGRTLKYGAKYPDYQTRLLIRSRCRFSNEIVHEKVIADGAIGTLSNPLNHYSYPDMKTWIFKLEMFAQKKGEKWHQEGRIPSSFNFLSSAILNPAFRFIRRYIFKGGFLDGAAGFLACLHDFLTEFLAAFYLRDYFQKR